MFDFIGTREECEIVDSHEEGTCEDEEVEDEEEDDQRVQFNLFGDDLTIPLTPPLYNFILYYFILYYNYF